MYGSRPFFPPLGSFVQWVFSIFVFGWDVLPLLALASAVPYLHLLGQMSQAGFSFGKVLHSSGIYKVRSEGAVDGEAVENKNMFYDLNHC